MRPKLAAPKPVTKLKRAVTLTEAVIYGIGIILGAGIYALIGEAAAIAGNALWLSFVIAAILASFTALSYAELTSIFPKEAAEFVYVKNATKSRFLAFFIGYIAIVQGIFAIPTVSLAFAGYLSGLLSAPILLSAIALIAALSLLNFIGIKESAKFNIISTLVEAGGLVIIIILGIGFIGSVNYFEIPAATTNVFEFLSPVVLASALIFFAYLGFEDLANISEEVVEPKKNIPKALIISLVITTILYILVSIVSVSVVSATELGATNEPLALVAEAASGGTLKGLLSVIALFATANTVLILLIVVSRMLYGMATEGSLPKFLGKIHSKTQTPYIAIGIICLISLAFVLIGDIRDLAFLTNAGVFIVFFSVNASLIIMRFTQPDLERGFRVPFNIGRLPIIPLLGAIFCLYMLLLLTEPITILGFSIPLVIVALIIFCSAIPIYLILNLRKRI